MTLPIAQLGQPVLRRRAEEVSSGELDHPDFRRLLADMVETLVEARGAGLAAPQVFVSRRLFLALVKPPEEGEEPLIEVFINPRIVDAGEDVEAAWEGCLSFPELLVQVSRPTHVRMAYLNHRGEDRELDLDSLPARIVQHELDHLDGILTIDRAANTRDIIKASEIDVVLRDRANS
jgi:peptide deformylase